MKKIIFLFLIIFMFSHLLIAQPGTNDVRADVVTPKGSNVVAWILAEDPLPVRIKNDSDYKRDFPDATPIITYDGLSSTAKFNCHGYAWLRVEKGIDRWIGTGWGLPWDVDDPELVYMTDGSYTEVSGHVYPGKVYWGGAGEDHSAITTEHPDTVISKWNAWPLMRHHKDYSPFGPSSNYKYYAMTPPPPPQPAHCENCRQDGDELGLDCGGSCPPCEDAFDNRTIYQGSLKQENYAMERLSTSGSLVLNKEKAIFAAGEEVVLNPGFEVPVGTEFIAKTSSNPNDLTRNFRKVCVVPADIFSPNGDGVNDEYGVWLAGATFVSITIMGRWGNTVRRYGVGVHEDGFVPLWNGEKDRNGKDCPEGTYYYELIVTTYEGNNPVYRGSITLLR